MGVWYDAYTIFGIEYSYKELEHLKEQKEFKKMKELIDCNELPNLLSELFDNQFVTFITNNNYVTEKEQIYYLCIKLTDQRLYNNPNYELYNLKIKKECDRLNIVYKIPDIHNIVVKS